MIDNPAEVKAEICRRIADGESLRAILETEGLPASSTIFAWLNEDSAFSEQYARAREAQAEAIFDDILTIADDGRNDWMERKNSDGQNIGWVENGEAIRRSQLRIEARKWMAGKLKPKKYGDKIDLNLSGSVAHLTDEQLQSRIDELVGKAGVDLAAGRSTAPEGEA